MSFGHAPTVPVERCRLCGDGVYWVITHPGGKKVAINALTVNPRHTVIDRGSLVAVREDGTSVIYPKDEQWNVLDEAYPVHKQVCPGFTAQKFNRYERYGSPEWEDLRIWVADQIGGIFCERDSSHHGPYQLHEKIYRANLEDYLLDDLEFLCQECHDEEHQYGR